MVGLPFRRVLLCRDADHPGADVVVAVCGVAASLDGDAKILPRRRPRHQACCIWTEIVLASIGALSAHAALIATHLFIVGN